MTSSTKFRVLAEVDGSDWLESVQESEQSSEEEMKPPNNGKGDFKYAGSEKWSKEQMKPPNSGERRL